MLRCLAHPKVLVDLTSNNPSEMSRRITEYTIGDLRLLFRPKFQGGMPAQKRKVVSIHDMKPRETDLHAIASILSEQKFEPLVFLKSLTPGQNKDYLNGLSSRARKLRNQVFFASQLVRRLGNLLRQQADNAGLPGVFLLF